MIIPTLIGAEVWFPVKYCNGNIDWRTGIVTNVNSTYVQIDHDTWVLESDIFEIED